MSSRSEELSNNIEHSSTESELNEQEKTEIMDAVEELEVTETESEEETSSEEAVNSENLDDIEEVTGSGDAEEEDLDEETRRTIFIKGLDYDNRESDIREQMEKIGEVTRIYMPLTHDGRRNKGFVYVAFKKLMDAQKGLKLNDTMFLGRKVLVDQAKPKTNYKIYTVFVKNLSFTVKREELLEFFNKFGKVYNLSLPIDTENEGRNRGFCFVEYNDEELANKVADMKLKFQGRPLFMNLGNKNEERNERRGSDRLYGRKNESNGGFRNRNDRNDRSDRNDNNGGYRNRNENDRNSKRIKTDDGAKKSNKIVFDDE
ncbi:heterogeneous nuclear ribonucleoprotein A/B/D [Enteropsectra breve]|nr:heterogeneous nuclear ribonucleoprotein A/B/D [Enteropsectra breve]KAI5151582.1 heterogeneous nuclear ribonucleoprotein A/B/D [Enteropsectra breve]